MLISADELNVIVVRDQAVKWMQNHCIECRHCRKAMGGDGGLDSFCKFGRKRMGLMAAAQWRIEQDAEERKERLSQITWFDRPDGDSSD